jgi:hypothetical protein
MTCGNCGDDGSEAFFSHMGDQRQRLLGPKKCLVKYCPNTSDQGHFIGELCTPCAKALLGERSDPSATRILASIWPYKGLSVK